MAGKIKNKMFLKSQNRRTINSFFGENRLINQKPAEQAAEDVLAHEPRIQDLEKKIDEARKKLSENEKKINESVRDYNKKFGTPPRFGKPKHYEQALVSSLDKPDETIRQINGILNTEYEEEGRRYKIAEKAPSKKREGQASTLLEIRKFFEERKLLIVAEAKAKQEKTEGHMRALVLRSREVEEAKETEMKWRKRPEYARLENAYKNVIGKIISDPKFERFYKDAEGRSNPSFERQNKQLLFAILAKETNGFTTDFVLGEGFGNDPYENKKNYPYIYYEYLTRIKKFNPEEIFSAENDVKAKEAEMKAKGIPDGSALVDKLNAYISSSPQAAAKTGTFRNPFIGLDEPTQETNESKKIQKYKEYYKRRLAGLEDLEKQIAVAQKRLNTRNPAEKEAFDGLQKIFLEGDIKENKVLEAANYRLKNLEGQRDKIDQQFTRAYFSEKGNLGKAMELAMLKFQKAMDVADKAYNVGGRFDPLLQPGIRRLLIMTVYTTGVARYNREDKSGKYLDTIPDEHKWMVSKLAQSKYFNRSLKLKYREPEHVEFMIVAHYANMAIYYRDHYKDKIIPALEKLDRDGVFTRVTNNINNKNALPAADPRRQTLQEQINDDIKLIQLNTSITVTEANVGQILQLSREQFAAWETFYKKVEMLLDDPSDAEQTKDPEGWMLKKKAAIRAFIDSDILANPDKKLYALSTPDRFKAIAKNLVAISVNYNIMDAHELGADNYIEKMGITPDSIYKAYQEFLRVNGPEMKVDQWDNLLATKDGTKKLLELFKKILPPSTTFREREDFLNTFETMHGINTMQTQPPLSQAQSVALNIYTMLKEEIRLRDKKSDLQGDAHTAAMAVINGMTFGERATEYARGIIDMVIGPGQTIANRAAGAAILLMFWKMAKSAWKGESNTSKALRVLFMAGATELALKHITGEGVLDKLKLDGVSKALADTYEGVLIDRAESLKLGMSPDEQGRALMELRNVPFSDVMTWYENTGPDGKPINEKNPRGKMPRGININNILPGRVDTNKETKARRILHKTIENFFGYVGNKEDGKNSAWGHGVLKEVWIDSIKDPKFALKSAAFTRRGMAPLLVEEFRRNPKRVTWYTVMTEEIRISDVEALKKKSVLNQVKDRLEETAVSLSTWTQRDIVDKVGAGAEEFWRNVNEDYAPRVRDFLGEMGKAGARNLKYYEDKVELWYESKKVELRRVADEHWEVVWAGIKLPFQILYGADRLIIPWAGMKLRQFQEIFRPDSVSSIDHDLRATDIWIPEPRGGETPTQRTRNNYERRRLNQYFGTQFRPAFERAFQNGRDEVDARGIRKRVGMFYETGQVAMPPEPPGMARGIAYYVNEINQQDAGIQEGVGSVEENMHKMQIAAAKEAVKAFRERYSFMSEETIAKHMYPIHVYTKTAERGKLPPEKIYTFWRLPTSMSGEYEAKEAGRWTDYYNPNKYKERPPFIIKPEEGVWSNIITFSGLRNPALRTSADKATALAIAQPLRAYLWLFERGGNIAASITDFIRRKPAETVWLRDLVTMGEQKRQKIDEWLGSAGNTSLALSDFYKQPRNAKIYQDALDKAIVNNKRLNLGGISDNAWQRIRPMEYDPRSGRRVQSREWRTRMNAELGDFEGPPVSPDDLPENIPPLRNVGGVAPKR